MKKDTPWEWGLCQEVAFNELKCKFTEKPALLMPDPAKPFILESDASKWAVGAVLRQTDSNGELHLCGYLSASLSPTEKNYQIYDREMLAIIKALKHWHHLLLGAKEPIAILMDHKNLTFWRKSQDLNARQLRWKQFLYQFNFKFHYT